MGIVFQRWNKNAHLKLDRVNYDVCIFDVYYEISSVMTIQFTYSPLVLLEIKFTYTLLWFSPSSDFWTLQLHFFDFFFKWFLHLEFFLILFQDISLSKSAIRKLLREFLISGFIIPHHFTTFVILLQDIPQKVLCAMF